MSYDFIAKQVSRLKQYRCIPIAIGLPIVFGVYSVIGACVFIYCLMNNDRVGVYTGAAVSAGCLLFTISFLCISSRRVEIYEKEILCKGLLPKHTFSIEYSNCNIGMDYHVQNGNQVWWIYLCYGRPPYYKPENRANRINSEKIRPGFVRIMYSDEVYDELIHVLPKKQKTALISARRCAGFEKQGKLIF